MDNKFRVIEGGGQNISNEKNKKWHFRVRRKIGLKEFEVRGAYVSRFGEKVGVWVKYIDPKSGKWYDMKSPIEVGAPKGYTFWGNDEDQDVFKDGDSIVVVFNKKAKKKKRAV